MVAWAIKNDAVAVLAGARTAWAKAGTSLRQVPVAELARAAMQETLYRASWPAERLDEVLLGNVAMPADAANPARVAALEAGVPAAVPAMTVQRNCASGMEAVALGAARIHAGQAKAVLAGGAESMSTIPMLWPQEALDPAARLMTAKTVVQKLRAAARLRPRHFRPRLGLQLGLTDPVSGLNMGQTAEVLAHEFGVDRQAQDQWALRSHRCASAAAEAGRHSPELMTLYAGPDFTPVARDVGPRANQSAEALAKLPPLFDRRDGTVTAGNACPITDGGAALLLCDGPTARAEARPALGFIHGYSIAALEPARMGLGPVYAIDRLLQTAGLTLRDIGLIEINEAFAAQVLACLKALASDEFARRRLGRSQALGELDPQILNVNGGAIALGHPVGATGARLVLTLLLEMRRRRVEFGVAALCVGGGQGVAILLHGA
jgi:acetyl-CoA acetyltransferase family protein